MSTKKAAPAQAQASTETIELKYPDVSGNYTKETDEDASKPTAERIEKFTMNLKIIANKLVTKLQSISGAVEKDKTALTTLQEVIDSLSELAQDGDASGASAKKYIDGVVDILKTKKAVPAVKEFVPVFEPDFKEIFDKNGVKSAVEKNATAEAKQSMNKKANQLNDMITKTINPAIHKEIKENAALKDQVNIKKITDDQIIPDFKVNLGKLINDTKPPAGGNPYKTAKKQLTNIMSYIPGMSRKTQKKRHHRKH